VDHASYKIKSLTSYINFLLQMKAILSIILLLSIISSTFAATLRGLAICEDNRGKFAIPEIAGQERNCQYVRNNDLDLCDTSWIVGNRCPLSCGTCDQDHDHGEEHHDEEDEEEEHGHDHVDEHLQMTCDEYDELYLEHIVEIEDNCQGIIQGTDSECPYLCLQPMSVLHLYYSVQCPNREFDKTFTAVDGTSKCHDDDHGHEELAVDTEYEVCIDSRGKFKIPQLGDQKKNCQYVRNNDMDLCKDSWRVRNKCRSTCGVCAVNEEGVACKDKTKRFKIKQLGGERRNCQYVRVQNMDLCEQSWRVRNRCPMTCGQC